MRSTLLGRRSEYFEETRRVASTGIEIVRYRGWRERGGIDYSFVSLIFLFAISWLLVIGRLEFSGREEKTRAKTNCNVPSRSWSLLARVKLDNFSFQHCKLFGTSSVGGGYLRSSTTLSYTRLLRHSTIVFQFIPFFSTGTFVSFVFSQNVSVLCGRARSVNGLKSVSMRHR